MLSTQIIFRETWKWFGELIWLVKKLFKTDPNLVHTLPLNYIVDPSLNLAFFVKSNWRKNDAIKSWSWLRITICKSFFLNLVCGTEPREELVLRGNFFLSILEGVMRHHLQILAVCRLLWKHSYNILILLKDPLCGPWRSLLEFWTL